jgi:hypothetical protein
LDDGGTVARAIEALAVMVTIPPIVEVLRNRVHRGKHVKIKLTGVQRQLLVA